MRTHRRRLVHTPAQVDLPLDTDPTSEASLRAAYAQCQLDKPFEQCMRIPAMRTCLRNVAAGLVKRRARQSRT
jgi:hypothetical protein